MKFGSVCSGIEAASQAWGSLGWSPEWFSEIEPFPNALLAHHYPDVLNVGSMTNLTDLLEFGLVDAPDVLCGGTPCQAFSVAGARRSLADERGNLSLVFCEIANVIDELRIARGEQPSIVFWENVPGVLSTKDNAFGCFLAGLAGEDVPLVPAGDKWTNAGLVLGPKRAVAWRILDAQYFGLAQRRRRVFVVASAREGFDPAAVLFEFQGVRRDTAPSREPWKDTSGSTGDGIARCITTGESKRQDWETCNFVTVGFNTRQGPDSWVEHTGPLDTDGSTQGVLHTTGVRRLTPRECERLQGFPDDYTLVPRRGKPAADDPRYKAIGNSWAVPVVRWIGERIESQTRKSDFEFGYDLFDGVNCG